MKKSVTGDDFGQSRDKESEFLKNLVQSKKSVSIFLVSGIRLQGRISRFDDVSVELSSQHPQIIYKHAIATIMGTE